MFRKLAVFAVLLLWHMASAAEVDLARLQGWRIVVAPDAIPSEKYAAGELKHFLKKAGGADLEIGQVSEPNTKCIFIGPGKAMRASPSGFDTKGLVSDDLRILVTKEAIAIAGGRPRGTLYGVYQFLEDHLGVRFLTAKHTHVPRMKATHPIPAQDQTFRPPLVYRRSYYAESESDPVFATRLRNHSQFIKEDRLGGRIRMKLINHSFNNLLPTRRYGKEHPEYYCLVKGKRRNDTLKDWGGQGNQPCLTNPDVLPIVTENLLKRLKKNPDVANTSVSQNDNRYYCRCEKCAAVDAREESHMGSLLAFVNRVAERVEKEYPKIQVGTLAYMYSRKPPKTLRPRANVQIQLCSIECCMIHPIDDPNCPRNTPFCRDMTGWGRICRNVTIWSYNTNFSNYLLPCPNLRVIAPNIRYFVKNGARGIMMQGAYNAAGMEFSELRHYVTSRLLWNPKLDEKVLFDEFVTLHYGKAAAPIKGFIDHVHETALKNGAHRFFYGNAKQYGLDESVAKKGLESFARAAELAKEEPYASRVEKASLCALRMAIEPVWSKGPTKPDGKELPRLRELASRFFALCRKHGIERCSEGGSLDRDEKRVMEVLGVAEK